MNRAFAAVGAHRPPLAVPETADARSRSHRFDRCANACSLLLAPRALAGVARHVALRERRSVCSRWDTPSRRCCEYPPSVSRAADIRRAALAGPFRPDQKNTDTPKGRIGIFGRGRRARTLGTRFWSGCREKKNYPNSALSKRLPQAKIVFDAILMLLSFQLRKRSKFAPE